MVECYLGCQGCVAFLQEARKEGFEFSSHKYMVSARGKEYGHLVFMYCLDRY